MKKIYKKVIEWLRSVFCKENELQLETEETVNLGKLKKSNCKRKVFEKLESTKKVFEVDKDGRKVEFVELSTKPISFKKALKCQSAGLRLLTFKEAVYIMSTHRSKNLGYIESKNGEIRVSSLIDRNGDNLYIPFCYLWCSDNPKGKCAYTVNLSFSTLRGYKTDGKPHTYKNMQRGGVLLVRDVK